MNKKIKYFTYSLLIACTLVVTAQNKQTKKAQEIFENYSYATAIDSYEDLIAKGYLEEEIFKNLGNANYQNANYVEAEKWYGRLFAAKGDSVDADYMYRYAQTLKSSMKYAESNLWMQKYIDVKKGDVRAKKIENNLDYLETIEKNSGRYNITHLALNSSESDFAPSFKGEQLVFSSARDSGIVSRNVHAWNNKPFTNLYVATSTGSGDYGSVMPLSSLNNKTHESSSVFTKDGTTVYFTRNNSKKGGFSRDEEGISRLKIYRASLKDGIWSNITELPFNADGYSAAHPALSADERKLYFASDMEGTIGQSDIFVVDLYEDGSMGTPKNLGDAINTEGRETFPFVTASNNLYFSSDGYPGLGGLDVYVANLDDMDNLNIVNVGKPLNSEQDDFSFIINEETKEGFFTSNRDGGLGSDDIYGFTETKELQVTCNKVIVGIVNDKYTGKPLPGAKVAIYNSSTELISEGVANDDGSFSLEVDCQDGDYNLIASKEQYNKGDKMFSVDKANHSFEVEIGLEKGSEYATVGTDLIKFLNLSPVYFDLDKADIRPDAERTLAKVLEYMQMFPELKIEIRSHTDARASASYNDKLSERRAKETMDYLIANGIDKSRLTAKGYGESNLVNRCLFGEKCNEFQHQLNRRSEFIVVE